jgi:S-adenosylmethionine synthetase
MFGYACDETPAYMPAPIYYAHRIMEQQALVRKTGKLSFLRPDAKSQVTFRYVDGVPVDIDTVVVSTQHSPEVDYNTLRDAVIAEVILPVLPEKFITPATKFLINPTGRFVIGGPMGDSGLT